MSTYDLLNATVSVPANFAGVVVISASIVGIEAEVDYTENGNTVLDLSGKTEKVLPFLVDSRVEVLSTVGSNYGDHEGNGLVNDIEDNRRNNYGALMQPTIK